MFNQEIDKLKEIITCESVSHDTVSLTYVDVKDDYSMGMEKSECTLKDFTGSDFYSTVFNEYLDIINNHCLSMKHPTIFEMDMTSIAEEYNNEKELIRRKTLTKVKNCSNLIACEGRIGTAQWVIFPKSFYENYIDTLEDREYIIEKVEPVFGNITTLVDSNIEHIYIGRRNQKDQPGTILVYNENDDVFKYELVSIGYYPDRQYAKITLI